MPDAQYRPQSNYTRAIVSHLFKTRSRTMPSSKTVLLSFIPGTVWAPNESGSNNLEYQKGSVQDSVS
ncbi:hypothetical protein BDV12DRAFT_166359 [Aspergillus spectabilis]